VFDAIDDGAQGKPLCDLFIDDKNVNPTGGSLLVPGWVTIARTYGVPAGPGDVIRRALLSERERRR
jgi:hypothetical protein